MIEKLERNSGYVIREQELWVDSLYEMAKSNNAEKAILWRAMYWDAVNKQDRKQHKDALKLIKEAEKLVDRRNYEYDYMRIKRSRIIIETASANNLYDLYTSQYADMKYFKRVADDKTIGNCHMIMSKIFLDINEPSQALRECTEARSLFEKSKTPALAASAGINMALCMLEQGNYDDGLKLLKRLEKSPVASKDTVFHLMVLLNMSYSYSLMGISDDDTYRKMEGLVNNGKESYLAKLCNINIGSWYYRRRLYDKAIELFSSTLEYAEQHNIREWVAKCHRGLADCYLSKSDKDKAAVHYNIYAVEEDSLESVNMKVKIMNDEEALRIRTFNEMVYKEKEESRLRFMKIISISAVLILVAGMVCLYLWYRNKQSAIQLMREKMENERKQLMIEKGDRKMAATVIEMEEKKNALKSIRCMLDDAKTNSGIDNATAMRIKTQVKIHAETDTGWDTFRETFEKVYPHFCNKIKDRHPTLTEYDIRLCAYLVAGIDSKHIAMLLNVLPESLKKSRTRLRKKLAITSDTDLGEYLRTFNIQD